MQIIKRIFTATTLSIIATVLVLQFINHVPLRNTINNWFYDKLVKEKYRLNKAPAAINDIVLVLIDNNTLNNIPTRWPYPRSDFAAVINNLEAAGAKVIAFDFAFLGSSTPEDDTILKSSFEKYDNIVLACSVNENGYLDFCKAPPGSLTKETTLGIITKLQDNDGITRRALTYLISDNDREKGFLSWEMQILKKAERISLDSFLSEKNRVTFKNDAGKTWSVPVDAETKAFRINFTAHTDDFKHLSFYNVLKNNFKPIAVKNKIVLVGLASSILTDMHNTPIGWLPGVTLNANSFLTLYGQYFLDNLPKPLEYVIIIIAVILTVLIIKKNRGKTAYILIATEIALFFLLSYLLLAAGYIWNCFDFPFAVTICVIITKNIFNFTYRGLCD